MDPSSIASVYKEAAIENAPPLKIVHLMYEGALRFLTQAEHLDPATSYRDFHERVSRASSIVSELRLSLDATQAPELCARLSELYLFVEDHLARAMRERTAEPLADARAVLQTLHQAWKAIRIEGEAA